MVVKQIFLVEEIHVHHVLERETVSESVTLRRQRAVVERLHTGSGAAPEATLRDEESLATVIDSAGD